MHGTVNVYRLSLYKPLNVTECLMATGDIRPRFPLLGVCRKIARENKKELLASSCLSVHPVRPLVCVEQLGFH